MSISQVFFEILDRDVAHTTLNHLHHRKRIWLQSSSQLPDSVQIFFPIDSVDILQ